MHPFAIDQSETFDRGLNRVQLTGRFVSVVMKQVWTHHLTPSCWMTPTRLR